MNPFCLQKKVHLQDLWLFTDIMVDILSWTHYVRIPSFKKMWILKLIFFYFENFDPARKNFFRPGYQSVLTLMRKTPHKIEQGL